jgi:NDP-sugar pyrophosphorylase family protein
MDAMIFAAGLGTRLRPLTNALPKALVDVEGLPILERVARRLIDAGADRLIINTFHFPELIERLVRDRDGFGVDVRFSHELGTALDTGGGLAQAAPLFRRDAPFLLHNCDVLSDIDLRALYAAHESATATGGDAPGRGDAPIATLAVLPPSAERYLIFDDAGLCGYSPRGGGDDVFVRATAGEPRARDFTGIHVASPVLLDTLAPAGSYSIMMHYLALARDGVRIDCLEQPGAHWIDIGTHEKLEAARQFVRERA